MTKIEFKHDPITVLTSSAFQNFSSSCRYFYIALNAHITREQHKIALLQALEDYNAGLSLGLSNEDIYKEIEKNEHGYFVITYKEFEQYGLMRFAAIKYTRDLFRAGFITIAFAGYKITNGWEPKRIIYQFSDEWKKGKETWEDCHKACGEHQTEE